MKARRFGKTVFFERDWSESKSKPAPNITNNRGEISSFSHASTKRFMNALAVVDYEAMLSKFGKAGWLTLTYDGSETGIEKCKPDLDYLLNHVIPRMGFNGPCFWKAELQKRGAIHFHILYFGLDSDQDTRDEISRRWHKITGSEQDDHLKYGVDLAPVPDALALQCYLCKYVAKGENGAWSHGRVWGIRRKSKLIHHKEEVWDSDHKLSIAIKSLSSCGIHLPTTVYNIDEWFEYAEIQIGEKLEDRISYYKWKQCMVEQRKKLKNREKMLPRVDE